MSAAPRVIMQERDFLVVHKPAGMAVHDENKLGLVEYLSEGYQRRVLPVHRLDRGTCGIVIVAFDKFTAAYFADQFKFHKVHKTYIAIVHGAPPPQGMINIPLPEAKGKPPQPAVTHFRTLARKAISDPISGGAKEFALLRCEPKTGRFHQIRRHLKESGWPILGDEMYGGIAGMRTHLDEWDVHRPLLCSLRVEFFHPLSGKRCQVATQPDADFFRVAKAFDMKW